MHRVDPYNARRETPLVPNPAIADGRVWPQVGEWVYQGRAEQIRTIALAMRAAGAPVFDDAFAPAAGVTAALLLTRCAGGDVYATAHVRPGHETTAYSLAEALFDGFDDTVRGISRTGREDGHLI